MKEYALYKGEECLAIGTRKDLAKQFNVKLKTIDFYKSPAYLKRKLYSGSLFRLGKGRK